jgi:hypothetical protein
MEGWFWPGETQEQVQLECNKCDPPTLHPVLGDVRFRGWAFRGMNREQVRATVFGDRSSSGE